MIWVFFALRTLYPKNLFWGEWGGLWAGLQACPIAGFLLKYRLPPAVVLGFGFFFPLTISSCWCCLPAKEDKNRNWVPYTYMDTLALSGEQGQKVGEGNWTVKGVKAWSSVAQQRSAGEDLLPAELNSSSGTTAQAPFRASRADLFSNL